MTAEELLAELRAHRAFMVEVWGRLSDGYYPTELQAYLTGYDQAITDAERTVREGLFLTQQANQKTNTP